jgi:DNA-binding NtrC family response regulator
MARQRRDAGVAAVAPPKAVPPPPAVPVSSTNDLKVLEREMIEQTLQRVHFNKSKAAKDLGLSRQQLYVRMKKYGLG